MSYPAKITEILESRLHAKPVTGNAFGSDANFACGSFVRFSLRIDNHQNLVTEVGFSSNGCGYMLAASELIAARVSGKKLSELHSLDGELEVLSALTSGETRRADCVASAMKAMRGAFADFRSRQIEEFRGEKALICTCFGVTEEDIENAISDGSLRTLEQVSTATNAGDGCGSCRVLIEEILDSTQKFV